MSDTDKYERREVEVSEEHVEHDYRENPSERGKWVSGLIAVLGLWLLVQVLAFNPVGGNFWSDVIVGIALVVLGGYNYNRRANERAGSVAAGVFVALLGLWMIVTPFVLGQTAGTGAVVGDLEFWNDIIVGVLALGLGAYSANEARETRAMTPART
ncbi:SPW repeat protein [Haloarculaceae archaeon H-GB11]|nr:SPW repeat protein [Haloarculaceae archaeon H-GB1-1]MEA5389484.1 SPW repeat protein [Haloarculaceae archaeon H-GB11]